MSATSITNRHNTSGFYKASISKAIFGTLIIGHAGLNLGMFSHMHKYLICKIPDSLNKGEWWRLLTSKLVFIETKDAAFCLILIYYFRVFERLLGSRKFCSHLISMMTLSGLLEFVINSVVLPFSPKLFSGLMAVGPYGLILPWFVFYFMDIPSINRANLAGMVRVSGKSMVYLIGLQVMLSSTANQIMTLSCLIAGFLVKINFLRVQNWLVVPKCVANATQKLFGWLVDSSPPEEGAIGATIEIQRSQQMEALEQHLIQQQARLNIGRLPNARVGRHQRPPQGAIAEPSEANILLLIDMGFPRERATEALREAHDDLSTATAILLRNT